MQQALIAETMQTEMVIESLAQPLMVESTLLPKRQEFIVGRFLDLQSYHAFQCGPQRCGRSVRSLQSPGVWRNPMPFSQAL